MRLVEVFALQPFDAETLQTPNQMDMAKDPEYMAKKKGMVGSIQWMTPTQYIQACEIGFRRSGSEGLVRGGRQESLIKQYAKDMQRGDKFPMLELDYRGGFAQEGLHRAMAAEIINVKKVPVFITKESPEFANKRSTKPSKVKSQFAKDREASVVDDILGSFNEEAVKLRGFAGDDDPEAVEDFMNQLNDATQDHPFDSSQRIGWDGKSAIEVRAMRDHIHLAAIQTLAPGERSGSASSLIDDVIEISKRTGVKLRLSPKPFGTMKGKLNKRQLVAWYKRKGFVPASQGEMEFDPDTNNLNEYTEVVHDTEEGDGNIFGYVVDTDEAQLVNYFVGNHGVPKDIIDAIRAKYDTVAVARNIHVDEDYRGKGHGTELMTAFVEEAASEGAQAILAVADTLEDNDFDLVKWYESWGFETVTQTGSGPFMAMEL